MGKAMSLATVVLAIGVFAVAVLLVIGAVIEARCELEERQSDY